MPNPTVLLAGLVFALGLFGSGVSIGYKWEQRANAAAQLVLAQQAADRARQDAAAESAAALQQAKTAAAQRAAAREKRHALDLEIARDETARTCRVSDATFGVLVDAIRAANGAPPPAGRLDAGLPALPGTERPDSGRSDAGADGWSGRLRFVPAGKAGAGGVD